jgi:hypothetical protein
LPRSTAAVDINAGGPRRFKTLHSRLVLTDNVSMRTASLFLRMSAATAALGAVAFLANMLFVCGGCHPLGASGDPAPVSGTWKFEVPDAPEFTDEIPDGTAGFAPPDFKIVLSARAPDGRLIAPSAPESWAKAEGKVLETAEQSLTLRAPQKPGVHWFTAVVPKADGTETIRIPVLVMIEAKHARNPRTGAVTVSVDKTLIGNYKDPAQSGSKRVREHAAEYAPPKFFVRLTPETEDIKVSRYARAGQMVAPSGPKDKPRSEWTRHIDLFPPRPAVYRKLDLFGDSMRAAKIDIKELDIVSAFRTPAHNRQTEGSAEFSRHPYGDAIDFIVDISPRDHKMDDLNGDGKVDRKDGLILCNLIRKLESENRVRPGGIGLYEYSGDDSALSHVHLDARGFITRWGVTYKSGSAQEFQWWPTEEFEP